MASTLLVVTMLACMATSVHAAATALLTYDGSDCKPESQDQSFTVESGGDICSGCTATEVMTEGKGSQGTQYVIMKPYDHKHEIHVFGKDSSTCPYVNKMPKGMTMAFSSKVMADLDKFRKGECIDVTLSLMDDYPDIKTQRMSMKLTGPTGTGTCTAPTPTKDTASMAKHGHALGGLLITLVTMHVAFLVQ